LVWSVPWQKETSSCSMQPIKAGLKEHQTIHSVLMLKSLHNPYAIAHFIIMCLFVNLVSPSHAANKDAILLNRSSVNECCGFEGSEIFRLHPNSHSPALRFASTTYDTLPPGTPFQYMICVHVRTARSTSPQLAEATVSSR
jgi:hypothetical protein